MSETKPKSPPTFIATLALFFALSMAVFFGVATLIFVVRGEDANPSPMPDLTGKYYVDVHNDLNRLQLRVSIERKQFPDQGPGIVLYQSIPPQQRVNPHEKLHLVVNQPEPLIEMPDFLQNSEQSVMANLRATYEDRVYELNVGAISEIVTEEYPANTIIAQFPPPGARMTVADPVYFLVSRRGAQPVEIPIEEQVGQNITILSHYLHQQGYDYRIERIEPPPVGEENATVFSIEERDSTYFLGVYFLESDVHYSEGYELLEVELDEAGICRGEVSDDTTDSVYGPRRVFQSSAHAPDEVVQVIFFRKGTGDVRFWCGESLVYDREIEPDDLS